MPAVSNRLTGTPATTTSACRWALESAYALPSTNGAVAMWQHDCVAACCSQLWCVVDRLANTIQHSLDYCLVTKQNRTFVLSSDHVTLKFAGDLSNGSLLNMVHV